MIMQTVTTDNLFGAALDWAIAKCEGFVDDHNSWLYEATITEVAEGSYHPSVNWAQAGPIIEREGISIRHEGNGWYAVMGVSGTDAFNACKGFHGGGDTPLEAAMRCYVASKMSRLSDDGLYYEVDIPAVCTVS